MWSRVVEAMIGCWLLMCPFIFQHPDDALFMWVNHFATGAAVILFALSSYVHRTRRAHWLSLLVGCWLVGFAYWHGFGAPAPAFQNDLLVGLLLLMFAIIPNDASHPAITWREPAHADGPMAS